MKVILKLFFITFFSLPVLAHPFKMLTNTHNVPICYLYDHAELLTMDPLQAFELCAITMDYFLQGIAACKKPIIIRVPEHIDHVSTIAEDAYYTEGVRVAMTWASAFNRFEQLGSLDIRIVHFDESKNNKALIKTIQTILNKCNEDYTDIYERVYKGIDISVSDREVDTIKIVDVVPYEHTIAPSYYHTSLSNKEVDKQTFLITGAAGFIGSHLCKRFLSEGHNVIGIDNFTCCNKTNILPLLDNSHFSFIQADVTKPFDVNTPIDCVVHLASVPSPKYYYAMPLETLRTGLVGTKNTLDIACKHKARYVFASTSEVYGDPEESPQSEDYCGNVDPIGMRSQYDQSKRGAETLIKLYAHRHGLDARIARIFNTYGPGMQLDDGRVITNFIQAHLNGLPLTIHGNGNQTRSFAYVTDTVEGIYKLITSTTLNQSVPLEEKIFNIGTPEEHTINELAGIFNEVLVELGMRPSAIQHIPQFDLTDPKKRLPNISRAQAILNFDPITNCREGLKRSLSRYLNDLNMIK